MLFRFFVLGLLIALVYRLAKRFFKALIRSALNQQKPPPEKPKPSWDVDKSRIKDAEFRDLDS